MITLRALLIAALVTAVLGPLRTVQAQARASAPGPVPVSVREAAEVIRVDRLRDWLTFIASGELQGRGTPSPGLDSAASYIAARLSTWGLKPGAPEGSYFQRIPIVFSRLDTAQSYLEVNGRRFTFPDNFGLVIGPPFATETVSAPLVFAGYGWVIKRQQINPYEGLDVKGKILVYATSGDPPKYSLLRDPPMGLDLRSLGRRRVDYFHPLEYALAHGAAGLIAAPTLSQLSEWQEEGHERLAASAYAPTESALPPLLPMLRGSLSLIKAIFAGEKFTPEEIIGRALARDPLPSFELGKTATIHLVPDARRVITQNVVAFVEGSDARLKDEFVIVGAHYDGQGIDRGATVFVPHDVRDQNGDSILHSADDNGSGTVGLMAIAQAFARGPHPKRSVMFAWWTGEEGHELGSGHFRGFPLIPLPKQVAYINLDMIGRTTTVDGQPDPPGKKLYGPDELDVSSSSSMLDDVTRSVNDAYLKMKWNYSKAGGASDELDPSVPIIFFEEDNEDHHRPTDTADKIDYRKLERVARSVYATVWALANANERPRQDKPRP